MYGVDGPQNTRKSSSSLYVYGTDTAIKPYVLAKHKNVARQVEPTRSRAPTTVSSFLPARACVDRTPRKEHKKNGQVGMKTKSKCRKNKCCRTCSLASTAKPGLSNRNCNTGCQIRGLKKHGGYKTKKRGKTAVRGYTRPNAKWRRSLPKTSRKLHQETRAGGKISHEGKYSPWNGGCKGGRSLTDVTGRTPEARTWQ